MARLLLLVSLSCTNARVSQTSTAIPRQSFSPTKLTPFRTLSDGYSELVQRHYLPMACVQAGILASCADIATQVMESRSAPLSPLAEFLTPILQDLHLVAVPGASGSTPLAEAFLPLLQTLHLVSPPSSVLIAHVLAMATVASTMSGGANAVWLRMLERAFPGRAAREVAAKTLIHAVILASFINSAYLVGVPLLTAFYSSGTLPALSEPSAYLAGWSLDEFIVLTQLEICMFIPYNTLAFKFVPPRVRPLTHAMVSATFNVAVSAVTLGYFDVWCDRAVGSLGLS